jgi:LPS export ABC transporter protein LptC
VIRAPLAIALGLVLLAFAASASAARGASDVLRLDGMTFVGSRGSSAALVLEAEQAHLRTEDRRAFLERVKVQAAETDVAGSFRMTCDEAELDLETSSFLAKGDVRGQTGDGRTFRTTWARFDQEQGVVWTDAPVTISDGEARFEGGGFRYHLRERRMVLSGGARLVQEPQEP